MLKAFRNFWGPLDSVYEMLRTFAKCSGLVETVFEILRSLEMLEVVPVYPVVRKRQ